jgi:hypothetical protein
VEGGHYKKVKKEWKIDVTNDELKYDRMKRNM